MTVDENSAQAQLQAKNEQFEEFFNIEGEFKLHIRPHDSAQLPSIEEFENNMPLPFLLSGEIGNIDQDALRSLRRVDKSVEALVDVINAQSRKINLLVHYILSKDEDSARQFEGISFGGGGIRYLSDEPQSIGHLLEMKLFFEHENAAVMAIGEVIECKTTEHGHEVKVVFALIRGDDREVLVRCSLHEQSKQLHRLAKAKKKDLEG